MTDAAPEPHRAAVRSGGTPLVSIIVCYFNAIKLTAACLDAIARNTPAEGYEVILVDDASDDAATATLAARTDVRYLRAARNGGFTLAANLGAREATGAFVLFLNNDTEVQAGWLDALLDAAADGPDVGAVGAMMLFPDGRLQEAGSILWNDASAWQFGGGTNASAPEYRYRREADYCSGSCLMVRRDLFEQLGGFDEYFAPGYYEDADLCLSIWASGHTVLYEPFAQVRHIQSATFEAAAKSRERSAHSKRAFDLNRLKFQAKWADDLLHRHPPHTSGGLRGGRRPDRPRVLMVEHDTTPPDEAAGALRMAWIALLFHAIGCEVTFFPVDRLERRPYTDWLRAAGIEVHCGGGDLEAMGRARPGLYDIVMLSRPAVSASQRAAVMRNFPSALLVYDAVDLHFLREERQFALSGSTDSDARKAIARARRAELDEMRAADVVSFVTAVERDVVRSFVPDVDAILLPTIHTVREAPPPGPSGRADALFIGGYRHPPNIDAVLWFAHEILPLLAECDQPVALTALGSYPTPELTALRSPQIAVPGYQAEVAPYFDRARVFVAPLRVGAGMKGKIGMAMSLGLPVVTTSIGAEGMGLEHGVHALIADDATGFAEAVVRLSRDDALWEALSRAGRERVAALWSPETVEERLRALVERAGAARGLRPRSWGRRNPELAITQPPGAPTLLAARASLRRRGR